MAPCNLNAGSMKSFVLQVLVGRLFFVFASILIMSVNGTSYMFGLYSNQIKTYLGYDQTTLNLLGFYKDLGGNLGVTSGLIYEVLPPWAVLLIGAVMNFSSYFLMWLAVTGRTVKPRVWQMCLYTAVGANSLSFSNTASLVTCVKNIPEGRGVVIGLLKGFIGLSGAIILQLYHAFYGGDPKSAILLIAWLPSVVSLVFLQTIRVMKADKQALNKKVFYIFLYISLGLAGFLTAIILVQNRVRFTKSEYIGSALVVLILLLLPLAVVIKEEIKAKNVSERPSIGPPTIQVRNEELPIDEAMIREALSGTPPCSQVARSPQSSMFLYIASIFKPPERGMDYSILQAIFSIDMIMLFIVTICGSGGIFTAIDNLGQIGESLGYPAHSISTFVSLLSIWNYLGRVFAGYSSEILLHKYKFPRPLMLTFILFLSCIGHLLIACAIPNSLYLTSMIMGFCLGAQIPLVATIISELFGLKHYSTMYNVGSVSSPVGSYIFNVKVAGHWYDKEALRQMTASGLSRKARKPLTCLGSTCYKLPFVIITAATFFGCLVSIILVLRTKKFYEGDIYEKFRSQEKVTDDSSPRSNRNPSEISGRAREVF